MKYEVLIMPSAEGELEEAYQWISERAPAAAAEWYNAALDACLPLETFPELSPLAAESKTFEREIRQLIYGTGHHAYRILQDSDAESDDEALTGTAEDDDVLARESTVWVEGLDRVHRHRVSFDLTEAPGALSRALSRHSFAAQHIRRSALDAASRSR